MQVDLMTIAHSTQIDALRRRYDRHLGGLRSIVLKASGWLLFILLSTSIGADRRYMGGVPKVEECELKRIQNTYNEGYDHAAGNIHELRVQSKGTC